MASTGGQWFSRLQGYVLTKQIERFKRILMLMPTREAISYDACTCSSRDDPSPWFHKSHCPVCVEFWQHQAAAYEAVDAAMEEEQQQLSLGL